MAVVLGAVGGVLSAVTISAIYDRLLGPDPRRFGFASNVLMDTAVVIAAMALAAGVLYLLARRATRNE